MPWDEVVIEGVAWGAFVSVLISILKGWLKLEGKAIRTAKWALGGVGMALYAILYQEAAILSAIVAAVTGIISAGGFHEMFGHDVKGFLGKSSEQ